MQNVEGGYVAIGVSVCPVCARQHHPGVLLIHKRLKTISEDQKMIPPEQCTDCATKIADGYVGMIGVDTSKSDMSRVKNGAGSISAERAHRTGAIVWVKKAVLAEMLSVPIPGDYFLCPQDGLDRVVAMANEAGVDVPVEDLDASDR